MDFYEIGSGVIIIGQCVGISEPGFIHHPVGDSGNSHVPGVLPGLV
ncbi:MAG: hypothetical protein WCK88_03600 [bacterium]